MGGNAAALCLGFLLSVLPCPWAEVSQCPSGWTGPSCKDFSCDGRSQGSYPDPSVCHMYYTCVDGYQSPVHQSCGPAGWLAFSQVTQNCEWPQDVPGCGPSPFGILGVSTFVNPDDPLLVEVATDDGNVIQAQGDKTEEGAATSVESLTQTTPGGDETTVGFSPDSALVDTVVTSSGVSMTFTWTDDKVYVTASAQNSSFELNVQVDLEPSDMPTGPTLSEVHGTATVSESPTTDHSSSNNGADSAQTGPMSTEEGQTTGDMNAPSLESANAMAMQSLRLPVMVTRCGLPADDATVKAFGYKMSNITPLLATDISSLHPDVEYRVVPTGDTGKFEIVVPASPADPSPEAAQTVCNSVSQVVGGVCAASLNVRPAADGTICNEVADAAQFLTTQSGAESALVLAACSGGFGAVQTFCDAIGFNGAEQDASSDLCQKVTATVDSFTPEPVLVVPKAVFPSGEEVSVPGKIVSPGSVNQTIPAFSISSGSGHVISSVDFNPRDPLPGQSYVGHARFACTDVTTVATMKIVGTDGYQNEVQCAGAISECTLRVPGAQELVVDRVTTSLQSGAGPAVSRESVIVF
ncbi:uncharacterized protein LOC144885137 [Branchiostoma floridae x Branchiostoma japonicum]